MNTSWYNVKIKFQEVAENDKVKTVSESYLFDAVSYTDAETRGYDFFAGNQPEFQLFSITKMKLAEVFLQDLIADVWFKCRVQYIIFDEKTKQEKKTAVVMLINANNIKEAYDQLKERLGSVEDYIISDINATKILEVIPYELTPQQKMAKGNFKPVSEVIPAVVESIQVEPEMETESTDDEAESIDQTETSI